MAKETLQYYFQMVETTSIDLVPSTPGALIVEDGGQAYYDASTGTRIKLCDQASVNAAIEDINTQLGTIGGKADANAAAITALEGVVNDYKTTNDAAVAKNAEDIAKNVEDIAKNAEDIAANAAAIEKLNGDDSVEGSVDYKVAQEVAKILNDNDATDIDTLEEIAAWIKNDTAGVADLNAKVGANEAAIKTINETTIPAITGDIEALDGELDALSGTVTENAGTLADHIANKENPHGVTCEQIGAATTGALATVEGKADANAEAIATNTGNIATNTGKIAANEAAIADNADAIAAVDAKLQIVRYTA